MWNKLIVLMLLLFTQSPVLAMDITCDTGFMQLIQNAGEAGKVKVGDLKKWVKEIKKEACAFRTLKQYSKFKTLVDSYTQVKNMDPIDLINRANHILVAIDETLTEEIFYPVFESKMEALPKQINQSLMKNFRFQIFTVTPRGAPIRGLNITIGDLSDYKTICLPGSDQDCLLWGKSIRFFAALTYLSSNISEQYSLKVLEEYRTYVVKEIKIWDSYYETRKPQLPWEMLTNEYLQRDIRTAEYFARPPEWDLVFMHPQLVYTDIRGNLSEGQVDSQLIWEVVGANFWNDHFVSGVSVMTASLDNTDKMGLNLTLKNKYSIGYIDDNDGTWYLSVDLYDFVADKKNAFKDQLKERMKAFQ